MINSSITKLFTITNQLVGTRAFKNSCKLNNQSRFSLQKVKERAACTLGLIHNTTKIIEITMSKQARYCLFARSNIEYTNINCYWTGNAVQRATTTTTR